jgi:hypothetical protein
VASMEQVLDVYKQPYNEEYPLVCMDESPKQLIKETRKAIEMHPGSPKRIDFEYERCGTCNVFIATEPLKGRRFAEVKVTKTKKDWAYFIKELADKQYKNAKKIILVMDNLNTHTASSLYEVFLSQRKLNVFGIGLNLYTPQSMAAG